MLRLEFFKQLILKEIFVVVFFSEWIFCFLNLFLDDVRFWKKLGPQAPLTQRLCAFSFHPSLTIKRRGWEPGSDRLSEMWPRRRPGTTAQVGFQWLRQESHYNKPTLVGLKLWWGVWQSGVFSFDLLSYEMPTRQGKTNGAVIVFKKQRNYLTWNLIFPRKTVSTELYLVKS